MQRIVNSLAVKCHTREGSGAPGKARSGTVPITGTTIAHIALATWTVVACPRLCGEEFTRKSARDHEDKCSYWCCINVDLCGTRTTRHNLPEHEKLCKACVKALESVRQAFKAAEAMLKTKKELKAAQKRISELGAAEQRRLEAASQGNVGSLVKDEAEVKPDPSAQPGPVAGPSSSSAAPHEAGPATRSRRAVRPSLKAREAASVTVASTTEIDADETLVEQGQGGAAEPSPPTVSKKRIWKSVSPATLKRAKLE
ncbi:hypothetical protein JCM10212_004420 [Sporobolomyces blumeae]